jgi:hypothetical protein
MGLTGATGATGATGPTGVVEPDKCTRIQSTNWRHGDLTGTASGTTGQFEHDGFRIAFEADDVHPEDLHVRSMIVQTKEVHEIRDQEKKLVATLNCWCDVVGEVIAVNFTTKGDATTVPHPVPAGGKADGVIFLPGLPLRPGRAFPRSGGLPPPAPNERAREYRVLLKGDYVRGVDDRAVDANHLPPWVPIPGSFPDQYRTGDGKAGGLFESWLFLAPGV